MINVMELATLLKRLPHHFEESFSLRAYHKFKNLPSQAFKPVINAETMLFTDILPPLREVVTAKGKVTPVENRLTLRPINHEVKVQIELKQAIDIPFPDPTSNQGKVIKRLVRVLIFDREKKEFIKNSTFVTSKDETQVLKGRWNFPSWKSTIPSMNPIIFLTTGEDMNIKHCDLIFELVMIFNDGREMTCGYATLPVENLKSGTKSLNLEGGNPQNKRKIDGSMLKKSKIQAKLQISI